MELDIVPDDISNLAVENGSLHLHPRGERRLACRQCRARKVKCDRNLPGCVRCARLDLPCSYSQAGQPLEPDPNAHPDEELTQAGTKRRRIRSACMSCRSVKAKCSGSQPCSRCLKHKQPCDFAKSTTWSASPTSPSRGNSLQHNAPGSSEGVQTPSDVPAHDPGTVSSMASGVSRFDDESKDVVRGYLEAYFDKVDISDCPFLHRGSVMADWSQDRLDPILLKAICATSLRWLCLERSTSQTIPRVWMRQVQQDLLYRLGGTTIAYLQTLILLLQFHFTTRVREEVWMLLSMAARIAFTKKLNYEKPNADPVTQECLRRLMWAIYQFDKIFSGGLEDLTLCPTHRMRLKLPSSDRCFQRGLRSRSPTLYGQSDDADMDVLAYRMKLYDIRDRILRYTREVVIEGISPFTSQDNLYSLDHELTAFREGLPEELQTEGPRLMLMCHSADARAYTTLHTIIRLCRCDLHRFLIPGIRESVNQEAMSNTPREFISHCQWQCLDSALRLCDFWSEIYVLKSRNPVDSPSLAIAIYQVTKIFDHLSHLLPSSGDHALESLKIKLNEALALVDGIQAKYEWIGPCVADIQNLIPKLGSKRRSPNMRSAGNASPPESQLHRRSKHAFALEGDDSASTADKPGPPPEGLGTNWPFDQNKRQLPSFLDLDANDPMFTTPDDQALATSIDDSDLPFALDPFSIHLHAYADAQMTAIFPEVDQSQQ